MTQLTIHNRPNRPYELLPFDPEWKDKFEAMKLDIGPLFGSNLISIEHIGSTSVPGMIAKPQIDAIIIVKDLELVKSLYDSMAEHGYGALGNFIQRDEPAEYFRKDDANGKRIYSVHVMQEGNFEIEDSINFRNYLREVPQARTEYIEHKKKLQRQYGVEDFNSYGLGKFDFLEALKVKARAWRDTKSK